MTVSQLPATGIVHIRLRCQRRKRNTFCGSIQGSRLAICTVNVRSNLMQMLTCHVVLPGVNWRPGRHSLLPNINASDQWMVRPKRPIQHSDEVWQTRSRTRLYQRSYWSVENNRKCMRKIPFTCSSFLCPFYDDARFSDSTAAMVVNNQLDGTRRPWPKHFPGTIFRWGIPVLFSIIKKKYTVCSLTNFIT